MFEKNKHKQNRGRGWPFKKELHHVWSSPGDQLCSDSFLYSEWSEQCNQIVQFIGLWAIFWKPLSTINLSKSPTFLGNFRKGVKIYHFSIEINLGNFYRHLATFYWSHCIWATYLRTCNRFWWENKVWYKLYIVYKPRGRTHLSEYFSIRVLYLNR